MSKPRITVIVPCCDEAIYLERTLCSVLDQGYEDLELLVADGGSTDGTLDVLAGYGDHIAWSCSRAFTGPAEAINTALPHATGEVIGILHAGDLYLPDTLHAVGQQMAGPDAAHWLAGDAICIDLHDGERGRLDAAAPDSFASYLMHDSGLLPASAVFYHRSLLCEQGGCDARYRFAWDYELHARLMLAGHQPDILSRVLTAHREGGQPDRMRRILRQGAEFIAVAERYAEQLPIRQQYALWRNCDERRRIYALAEAEAVSSIARRRLWQQLLRRPWWLASAAYRRMLMGQAQAGHEDRHAA